MNAVDAALGFLIACLIIDRIVLEGRLAWMEVRKCPLLPPEEKADE